MLKSGLNHFSALFLGILAFSNLTTLSGCTSKPAGDGKPEFKFAPASVQELTIAESDPSSGTSWTATFAKKGPSGDEWLIESAPGGKTLLDRKADGGFIAHLVDTLRYLKPLEVAPKGPPSSFGLEPPHSAIRWRSGEQSFEVHFGEAGPKSQGRFARRPNNDVWIVSGATLGMLGTIESFDGLRKRTLTTLSSDDIDEVEVRVGGKQVFYAQRLSDGWANAKEMAYPEDFEDRLEGILKHPVEEFVDDAAKAAEARAALEAGPWPTLVLKGPTGSVNRLTIGSVSGEVFAYGTSRPDAPFKLQPQAAGIIQKLSQTRLAR